MENASGQGPAEPKVDWSEVLAAVVDGDSALEGAATKLSTARDRIASSEDQSSEALKLLKEELDDVRGRFGALRETLESQSGPEVEAAEESDDESDDKDDG